LAAGHHAAANGPRSETERSITAKASRAKAAPSRSTADTRQTQTNEESEAEGPFGADERRTMGSKVPENVPCPYCGKPMRLVGRTATHARYICTGPTCRQTYEKPLPKNLLPDRP
jgi:hypothetical protein